MRVGTGMKWLKAHFLIMALLAILAIGNPAAHAQWTNKPASTVRLCWIHHSCGSNWTHSTSTDPSYGGNLGQELNNNNYYITECDYDWDAEPDDNLGNSTDTGDWHLWFNDTKMPYVYANSSHYDWTNTIADPGGENTIIMFKSCYPLSEVGGGIADEKALYNDLLPYFAAHTDKFFVLITPPAETHVSSWVLTEELCNWLVHDWLDEYDGGAGYPHDNVAVFDFYNVLSETDAYHRVSNQVQHYNSPTADATSPYHDGDEHPNSDGNVKATREFVPLLNYFYNMWQDSGNLPVRINFQPSVAGIPLGNKRERGRAYGAHGGYSYGWL